jgi:hypothetical protein
MNVEIYHVLLKLEMVDLLVSFLNLYNKRASNSTSSLANMIRFALGSRTGSGSGSGSGSNQLKGRGNFVRKKMSNVV